jgi:hypothetical protein
VGDGNSFVYYHNRNDWSERTSPLVGDGNIFFAIFSSNNESERTSPLVGDGLFRKLGSWEAGKIGEKRVPALLVS